MIILSPTGSQIASFEDWSAVFSVPKKQLHWKEHRSAHSIADFALRRGGFEHIRQQVSAVIGNDVQLDRAIIEQEVRFDCYGHGREHDLGIYGHTEQGESVYIGLEAKVDESFGDTVQEVYLKAKANELSGVSTNAPQRIEQLLQLHFNEVNRLAFNLRYQLLYATAGTLAAKADFSVFYTVVFDTPLYDEVKGAQNFRDYLNFMNLIRAERVSGKNNDPDVRRANIGGELLHCVYEKIHLR